MGTWQFNSCDRIRQKVKSLLVLESLPILILGSILLPDIVLASVHHEGEVALGVEAGGVVVLRSREVDRTSLQTAYIWSKEELFEDKNYSPAPLLSC